MTLKEAIDKYIKSEPARFHMPGHKGKLCPYDITELDFSDDLHSPCDVISQLQERCAKVYGADYAHILVNGSSGGICAMLTALSLKLHRPPRILVSRDCHKSFFSAAYISQSHVCGVYPENEAFGVITAENIALALDKLSEKPDCVFITSPNYYGMCADTESIYKLCKERGIYLFVDCAHGAHFPMSEDLPPLPCADLFCVSTHKTLSAFNQSGLLLCRCDLETELCFALDMLQTTSPSYPLMLSIEEALTEKWDNHLDRLSSLDIVNIPTPKSAAYRDISRVCIPAVTGYDLDRELRKHGIYAEMSDINCTVLITSPNDEDEWYRRLSDVIKCSECVGREEYFVPTYTPQIACYTDIRAVFSHETEHVPLKKSVGRVCARPVGIYPPGTAILFPGERITQDALSVLQRNAACGGRIFGADDYINVLKGE